MATVNLFPGALTNVPVGTYTGGLSFIGGGTSPWANNTDDVTQAVLEMDWGGSDFTTFTRVTADLPALVGTPTGLVAHIRARNEMLGGATSEDAHINVVLTTSGFSPFLAVGNEGSSLQHWPIAMDSVFRDYSIDLASPNNLYSTWGTTFSAVVAALQAGAMHFQVQTDIHTPHVTVGMRTYIAALWLEAVGITDGPPPPPPDGIASVSAQRNYPRSDGRGMSAAPRNYPPSPSMQGGNRVGGAVYL